MGCGLWVGCLTWDRITSVHSVNITSMKLLLFLHGVEQVRQSFPMEGLQ